MRSLAVGCLVCRETLQFWYEIARMIVLLAEQTKVWSMVIFTPFIIKTSWNVYYRWKLRPLGAIRRSLTLKGQIFGSFNGTLSESYLSLASHFQGNTGKSVSPQHSEHISRISTDISRQHLNGFARRYVIFFGRKNSSSSRGKSDVVNSRCLRLICWLFRERMAQSVKSLETGQTSFDFQAEKCSLLRQNHWIFIASSAVKG